MDVFLSYAREDRERAHQVANVLEESGWSVWWDRKIVAGEAFDQTIERQLESARCVVVLWSEASVGSEWVKNEAAAAAERQVLVPALIDDVKIPLEFRRRQMANLVGWDGDTAHEGFQALREGVARRLGAAAVSPAPQSSSPPAPNRIDVPLRWPRWTLAAAAALAAAAIGAYLAWGPRPARQASTDFEGQITESQPQQPASSRGGPARLDIAPAREVPATGATSIDNPAPLAFGAIHKVTLERNEEYYFRLSEPANAIEIVEDVRLQKDEKGNLQTQLSILDTDGGVVEAAVVRFNEIDVGFRRTASFSRKQPARWGFKLVNTNGVADVWLAVTPEGGTQFFPFFGSVVPRPWSAGKDATGTLEKNEDVYYLVHLSQGEHRAILDFAHATRVHSNLQGYLAALDADGGGQQIIMRLNEIGVSYRAIGSVTVKDDGPVILRLQNSNGVVNYNLRLPDAR